jgi:crossover junction endodeoxyribonuclease RuvC
VTFVVGIDPGLTGAIAFVSYPRGGRVLVVDTPSFVLAGARRDYDIPGMAQQLLRYEPAIHHVFIERQQARPEAGSPAVFKIGYGFGLWLGLVAGHGLPYTVVSPQVWERAMFQGAVGEGKDRSLLIASRLWPRLEIPRSRHDRADALLIAEYGRRVLLGRVTSWDEVD